jgi:hypothetical protein
MSIDENRRKNIVGIYLLAEKIADSRGTFKKQRISDSSDKKICITSYTILSKWPVPMTKKNILDEVLQQVLYICALPQIDRAEVRNNKSCSPAIANLQNWTSALPPLPARSVSDPLESKNTLIILKPTRTQSKFG